jgi:hypothetical protein
MTEAQRSQEGGTGGAEQQYAQQRLPDLMFDLSDKTAFVTGAARGMGSWIAMGMARCGADVALAGAMVAVQGAAGSAGICFRLLPSPPSLQVNLPLPPARPPAWPLQTWATRSSWGQWRSTYGGWAAGP